MAKLYYKRISAGLMAAEDVPALWRAQVREMLDASAAGGRQDAESGDNNK